MPGEKIFLSHASPDKPFVNALREKLDAHGVAPWLDAREMTGGDDLEASINKAIDASAYFIIVLSPSTINSTWVVKEIAYAKQLKATRTDGFKIIPLMLPGVEPAALKLWLGDETLGIKVGNGPGELDAAMPQILSALGQQLPIVQTSVSIKPPAPVAELLLELIDPHIVEEDGKRRAVATATLTYRPPSLSTGEANVESRRFRLTAPLGPIETSELTWYLEKYWRWPISVYLDRAKRVEAQLPQWGKLLYDAVRKTVTQEAFAAWEAVDKSTTRCFTVQVDREAGEDSDEAARKLADEATTLLFSLPWELLHDGQGFLFQGPRCVRVRRQLPNFTKRETYTTQPPVRVLLVSPRPEDSKAGYIDHRVSARPLVEALAPLGDLAELTVLTPPTFPAMERELVRAVQAGTPYHVVHFDGHGIYNPEHGLGALCFEDPTDVKKTDKRGGAIVDATQIAEAIRNCRVPLVFLEACQSAMTDKDPTASVAGKLLEGGVASVVAMSHSVLVETARRFVTEFYQAILHGNRVGAAMLAGQRALKNDTWRGKNFNGELHLQDWFVPVLYQEEYDPQLVAAVPNAQVQDALNQERVLRLGKLPGEPEQTFVGRSRELLRAERMLEQHRYVVLRGEGGEGKTTLAAELARWLVATGRYDRAAFVAFDQVINAEVMLSVLGDQLVPNFISLAGMSKDHGWQEVERALKEQRVLIVLDNMESVLPPASDSPAYAAFDQDILDAILALSKKLCGAGDARIIFTSREVLPDPFERQTIHLTRLSKTDAIDLVAKTLGENEQMPGTDSTDANDAEIEKLVDAVGCHARSLVLIAREVARTGVKNAMSQLNQLMSNLHKRYPNDRERSLFASVELSLRRLTPETRQRIRPLGAFQGGGSLIPIAMTLQIEDMDIVVGIAQELVSVGLVEEHEYGFLRFDPALAAALWNEMTTAEQETARSIWAQAMQRLASYLYNLQFSNSDIAYGLANYELPNLLTALEHQSKVVTAEDLINFATSIEPLAESLGQIKTVEQVKRISGDVVKRLGDWSHAIHLVESAAVDRLQEAGRLDDALLASEKLFHRSKIAGKDAYFGADYDLAMTYLILGRVRKEVSPNEKVIELLMEAKRRFTLLADSGAQDAARMVMISNAERADCLVVLNRYEEAEALYRQVTQVAEGMGDLRQVAAVKGQLATAFMRQKSYSIALQLYREAQETFKKLDILQPVAGIWHQTAMVHTEMGDYSAAENAHQESLRLHVSFGNLVGQADALNELGNLYSVRSRFEESVKLYREAIAIYVNIKNLTAEGRSRNNLALALFHLEDYDAARCELLMAIECKRPFGYSAELWKSFAILHKLEHSVGNISAALVAREKAIQAYLSYRRAGGESMDWGARVVALAAQALAAGQTVELLKQLEQIVDDPKLSLSRKLLAQAVQQILGGSRDIALADNPDLHYMDAVELRLLLEGYRTTYSPFDKSNIPFPLQALRPLTRSLHKNAMTTLSHRGEKVKKDEKRGANNLTPGDVQTVFPESNSLDDV